MNFQWSLSGRPGGWEGGREGGRVASASGARSARLPRAHAARGARQIGRSHGGPGGGRGRSTPPPLGRRLGRFVTYNAHNTTELRWNSPGRSPPPGRGPAARSWRVRGGAFHGPPAASQDTTLRVRVVRARLMADGHSRAPALSFAVITFTSPGRSLARGGAAQTKDRTRRPPAVPGGSGGFHGT